MCQSPEFRVEHIIESTPPRLRKSSKVSGDTASVSPVFLRRMENDEIGQSLEEIFIKGLWWLDMDIVIQPSTPMKLIASGFGWTCWNNKQHDVQQAHNQILKIPSK